MDSVLIICGTNRPDARTRLVAKYVEDYISDKYNMKVDYFDLQDLPDDIARSSMYKGDDMPEGLKNFQDEVLIPSKHIILVSPEYNGGLAGILKLFIDAISVRKLGPSFHFKKMLLIGVADGRAGNLRGMEHLTGILNHMKVVLYPTKLPLSSINSLLNEDKTQLSDESAKKAIHSVVDGFVDWSN